MDATLHLAELRMICFLYLVNTNLASCILCQLFVGRLFTALNSTQKHALAM